jgi:hypothetical protein
MSNDKDSAVINLAKRYRDTMGLTREGAIRRLNALVVAIEDEALRQPAQSDAVLTKMNEWCKAVAALKNPTPELVEAVAKALYQQFTDANELMGEEYALWEILGDKQSWLERADAALTATATHLFAENANECHSCQV